MKFTGKWVELEKVFSEMVNTDPSNLTGSTETQNTNLCVKYPIKQSKRKGQIYYYHCYYFDTVGGCQKSTF